MAGTTAAWLPGGGAATFRFTAQVTGEHKVYGVREKTSDRDVPIGVVRFTVVGR